MTFGLHIDYEFEFATLTSNTGFKDHDYFYSEDYDGTPLNIKNYTQDQEGDYFQQEFRLSSNNEGMFSWYAGASYYKEEIDTLFIFKGAEDSFCQYYGYAYNSGMTFTGCADLYAYYGSSFSPSADGSLTETGRIVGENRGWAAYVLSLNPFSDPRDKQKTCLPFSALKKKNKTTNIHYILLYYYNITPKSY